MTPTVWVSYIGLAFVVLGIILEFRKARRA